MGEGERMSSSKGTVEEVDIIMAAPAITLELFATYCFVPPVQQQRPTYLLFNLLLLLVVN